MLAGLPPPGEGGRGEGRGLEAGGREEGKGGPDSPAAVACKADPGLLRRHSVLICRPHSLLPEHPGPGSRLRVPSPPQSGWGGEESSEEAEEDAVVPGSCRARGLPYQGKGQGNGLEAWDPGGKHPGAEQTTAQPPPSYPRPHPLEPNSCVGRQEPVWPICNARPRGGCFRRQVERGVCALLGKG